MQTTQQSGHQVIWNRGTVEVVPCNVPVAEAEKDQVLVRITAAGICGADVRIVTGNKAVNVQQDRPIVLGHEGVGQIAGNSYAYDGLKPGDYVVVLPHSFPENHQCAESLVNPACIGQGHTIHMGWDVDGVFTNWCVAPARNLVPIPYEYRTEAARNAPWLQTDIFAWTEPMSCVVSSYHLLEKQAKQLLQRPFQSGKALVIGCGPIGILHAVMLHHIGYNVWFKDALPQKEKLAQECFERSGIRTHTYTGETDFDLVVVTASVLDAIKQGEKLVKNQGILYLFAGLNAQDREAADAANLFKYERVHRAAKALVTEIAPGKMALLSGHSGYFAERVPQAMGIVAVYAGVLEHATTGVIQGWDSPRLRSLRADIKDWYTPDRSSAIVHLLSNGSLRSQHCKVIVTC